MKARWLFLAAAFLCASIVGATPAELDEDGYNAHTIRASDIPRDAPRFEDYPASPYSGPRATPNSRASAYARQYRTRLSHWSGAAHNLAGPYTRGTWTCGTACTQVAVFEARPGSVFHTHGARWNAAVPVHGTRLRSPADLWRGSGTASIRAGTPLRAV